MLVIFDTQYRPTYAKEKPQSIVRLCWAMNDMRVSVRSQEHSVQMDCVEPQQHLLGIVLAFTGNYAFVVGLPVLHFPV